MASPNTVVWHAQYEIELDLTDDPHLGHPDRPGLLEEVYSPGQLIFRDGVLQCPQCRDSDPDCPEWMFIRRSKKGLLHAVHHNPAIRDHAEGESDTHKALKQRIVTAAVNGGLEAIVEDRAAHGRRKTDVLVRGGGQDLACEAQISYASRGNVQKRSKTAWSDGLTPLWTTNNPMPAWLNVAPWARLNRMPWNEYLSTEQLPVIGGVRGLVKERCGTTNPLCPDRKKGRPCTGWHFRWEPRRMESFDDLIVQAGHGEYVPYDHHDSRNTITWFWVRATDAAQVDRSRGLPKHHTPVKKPPDTRQLNRSCSWQEPDDFPPQPIPQTEGPIIVAGAPPATPPAHSSPTTAPAPVHAEPAGRPVTQATTVAVPLPAPEVTAYRGRTIIPGMLPIESGSEELAAANMRIFTEEVRARAAVEGEVRGYQPQVGEPVRDPAADRDGRYGWVLPVNGRDVPVLMPGADLARLRDLTAAAPLLQINDEWWWWNDAASAAVPLPARQSWLGIARP